MVNIHARQGEQYPVRSEEEKVKIAALWRLARVGGLSFGEEGLIKFRAWHPHLLPIGFSALQQFYIVLVYICINVDNFEACAV